MTLCCIGGVCIPYSALLPVAVWCLQWLVEKLGLKSYIPDAWWNMLQSKREQPKKRSLTEQDGGNDKPSCCMTSASTVSSHSSVHGADTGTALVRSIDSEDEWEQLLVASKSKGVVVIFKFTATWCRPCQAIQPVYEALAAAAAAAADKNSPAVIFGTIDVDELDAVASALNVAILPTVVVVKGGTVVDRYTGSHAGQLRDFCNRHTGTSQE
jgi:thioredoxin 1